MLYTDYTCFMDPSYNGHKVFKLFSMLLKYKYGLHVGSTYCFVMILCGQLWLQF